METKAILPNGFVDQSAMQIAEIARINTIIAQTYELYGFEALQTPFFEYSQALGKFLPDDDRPNCGVFSLQDDDEQWISLRYDLTAPLARYVAENYETIIKPYKSYRAGPVFRNEKAGPGRFREFVQFDADIVGAPCVSSDAQMCMMAADVLDNLGVSSNNYIIKVNNRKILDALLDLLDLEGAQNAEKRLRVLRSIDKLDKFGLDGVALLLGAGRLDASGDFTKGAALSNTAIDKILSFLKLDSTNACQDNLNSIEQIIGQHSLGRAGLDELRLMNKLFKAAGYEDRIKIDSSVVRGLGYYTGPVFEAQLLCDVLNNNKQKVVFGAVAGGGRYDSLIARFRDMPVPATGFSIGVSRLAVALNSLKQHEEQRKIGPVVVLRMDKDTEALASYQIIVSRLRSCGIACEIYAGSSGMKAQMKYADRRNAPCVIIQGQRERENGTVEIKDLIEGARLAKDIETNELWRQSRAAQLTVALADIEDTVKAILLRYNSKAN